jgi:3-hydroxyisobutyrate dehydrogenase-like beta-hydroxyacid dehydrogenase
MTAVRIAFLGIGSMGARMARRLIEAGYPLTVYNRTRERTAPLADHGATVAENPRRAAERADVVMSSLGDDTAVRDVLLGPDGALAGARPGTMLIDLSTILPGTSREMAATASASGASLIDAPVSGSTPQAEQGTLRIFAGGERRTYDACAPILQTLGDPVYLGPSGMGATMKLVVNTLLGLGMEALAEAVALGEKAGLDRDRMLDALGETSVVSPSQRVKMENVRRGDYSPTFPVRLMLKDTRLILQLAQTLSVPLPALAAALQVYAIADASNPEEDFSAAVKAVERLAAIGQGANRD